MREDLWSAAAHISFEQFSYAWVLYAGVYVADTPTASKRKGSTDDILGSDAKKQRKGLYFEFAKKKWENEDSFKLPDGTYWCGSGGSPHRGGDALRPAGPKLSSQT